MKTLAGWLLGAIVAIVGLSFVTRALRDAAFAYAPPNVQAAQYAPAPPLSTDCTLPQPALADCTIVLSSDPATYGVTVADMREELLQEWCTGLARRTDAVIHTLYPNRASYADFQLRADECR